MAHTNLDSVQKWEYAELTWNGVELLAEFSHDERQLPDDIWASMKALGDSGWEMVGFVEDTPDRVYVFKRRLP